MQHMDNRERLYYIDFLKFVGLIGIIIAHTGPPGWMIMLRNFDVSLMVILSSILGQKTYSRYKGKTTQYYLSRIKRLVVPTWIFLLIYFGVLYLEYRQFFQVDYYLKSFGFTRYALPYVWIILIYLYSAILIPVFDKIKMAKAGMVAIAIIYIVYEVAYYQGIGIDNKVFESTFYYIIPYGVLTYLGYNYTNYSRRVKKAIGCVAILVFIICAVGYAIKFGSLQNVQSVKYPPRVYYLSYGIMVSFILLYLCETYRSKIYESKVVTFVSRHSLWIYLVHILVLHLYDKYHLPKIWIITFAIVFSVTLILVSIMNKFLDLITNEKNKVVTDIFRG